MLILIVCEDKTFSLRFHSIYFFPLLLHFTANTSKTLNWWDQLYSEEEFNDMKSSGKLVLLFSILAECGECGDKLLVFSQRLSTLDVIEKFLTLITENTQNPSPNARLGGFSGQWKNGVDYFRLDGSTNAQTREAQCKSFNDVTNTQAKYTFFQLKTMLIRQFYA